MKIPTPTVIVGSGYFLTSFSNHMKYTRITEKTTRKDVIRLFGKGDQIEGSTDDAALFYGKSKFWGLKGTLRFVFFDDGELFGGYWTYRLKDEETFEDYWHSIFRILYILY